MTKLVSLICAIAALSACHQIGPVSYFYQSPPDESSLTELTQLPTSGTAHYDGRIGVGFKQTETISDARLVGDLGLTADFRLDEVNGYADNFEDRLTGEHLGGTLAVASSFDRRTDLDRFYGLSGTAVGTLRDRANGPVIVDLDLDGDFFGRSGSSIAGDLRGTVSGLPLTPEVKVTGVFEVEY